MNITLIGMPGSGKSYIGKRLAARLGFDLIEIDPMIEAEFNLPLQGVVDMLGSDAFIKKEEEIIITNTTNIDTSVISPGGSVVYSKATMEHLQKISKVIYLKVSLKTIKQRIGEIPRGIVNIHGGTIEDIFKERISLYEQYASFVVNGEKESEEIISEILNGI